jgi:hypothetical protein
MEYSESKYKKILAMEDSDEKLGKLENLGLSLGIFNKQPIMTECNRLRENGYISLSQKYLMNKKG